MTPVSMPLERGTTAPWVETERVSRRSTLDRPNPSQIASNWVLVGTQTRLSDILDYLSAGRTRTYFCDV